MILRKLSPILLIAVFTMLVTNSCTNLEEQLNGDLTLEQAKEVSDVPGLLAATYTNLTTFEAQNRVWGLMQHSTDETIGPTRGGDWDDNGVWRVLHSHDWDADHAYITDTWKELLEGVFNATNVLNFSPTPEQAAEARFLRAFFMFYVNDLYGKVPVREPGENLLNAPTVLSSTEANQFVIDELEEVLPDLPESTDPTRASKNAARTLLAKAYLNKGVYADRTAPKFESGDMDKVIANVDDITGVSLVDNYFDNFIPSNSQTSPEIIFVSESISGTDKNTDIDGVHARWLMTLHYNQRPGGWNGFATIAEFYDRWDPTDPRFRSDHPILEPISGLDMGFLEGQQFDLVGGNLVPLEDRNGNPLIFTKDVQLTELGDNLEVTGIRVTKYVPDLTDPSDPTTASTTADNDVVLLRYADALLMKAEAQFRKGLGGDALTTLNSLRMKRGAPTLNGPLTAEDILNERGFELYWEGHRRTDQIRFGTFLEAYTEKNKVSDPNKMLFPIPNEALAGNPNLTQNPGY